MNMWFSFKVESPYQIYVFCCENWKDLGVNIWGKKKTLVKLLFICAM
jgi:hypothetical protein